MNVFLDANILVSVLNKEYPTFTFSSRILSQANKKFTFFTSPICLAIAFYFAGKKSNAANAKKKIGLLCQYISIAPNSSMAVKNTLQNAAILDFEDGLEYDAAVENKCSVILTEDRNDFYFSEIKVLNSRDFCMQFLLNAN